MSLFVSADSLRNWAEKLPSRSVLPHIVRRLILATGSGISELDFPANESVQRPGFDGVVDCTDGNAWLPAGRSVWELSTEDGVRGKAQGDFDKRTIDSKTRTPKEEQKRSYFVFLTPRRFNQKAEWAAEQANLPECHWRGVRAYDADDIEQWVEAAPAGIQAWLGRKLGVRPDGVVDLAEYWSSISTCTEFSLTPDVFIAGRIKIVQQMEDWLTKDASQLAVVSRSPIEVIDFFAATVAATPIEQRERIEACSVLVRNREAWQTIVDSIAPSNLVVDPSIELEANEVARAIRAGHRVLMAVDPILFAENRDTEMPMASKFELANALEKSGYSRGRSEQLARSSGGSIAILKHRLAPSGTKRVPSWASEVSSEAITASLLLGGWKDQESDVAMFAEIAGRPYSECHIDIQRMTSGRDPLLLHAANKWRLISKDFAWSLFEDRVSLAAIERFESLAIEILADDDPRFHLPEKERLYANIHGHIPKYSATLKQHVAETLAFLGAFGGRLIVSSSISIEASVNKIVSSVLSPDVSWHRWASLGSRLTLLAEAGPNVFLRAVKDDLQKSDPELGKLLHEEEDAMFGRCNHSGLLWALEGLAWPQEHVGEVIEFLLKLVERDTESKKWGNRPSGSIAEILSYWMPQTTVGVDGRVKLLDLMLRIAPETARQILLKLLPSQSGGVSMPTHKPHWRDWANDWVAGATRQDSMTFITATAERIIRLAGGDVDRWCELLNHLGQLPYTTREQFLHELGAFAASEHTDAERRRVSEILSAQINQHRHFRDAEWSVPKEMLDELETALEELKPKSAVMRNAWLFAQWPDRFYERGGSAEERDKALETARVDAMKEILEEDGFSGVEQLANVSESPYTVGWALANATSDQFFDSMIPAVIGGQPKERDFAAGFIWKQYWPDNWEWVDNALDQCTDERTTVNLLLALRFHPNIWDRAAERGDDIANIYWAECRAFNPQLELEAVSFAVETLLIHLRPVDAMDVLSFALHNKLRIESDLLCRSLEALLELPKAESGRQIQRMDSYHIQEIIAELQPRDDIAESRMIHIEWHFIRMLDEHSGHSPKTLHKHLATSPEFFHEVLSACFRSRTEPDDEQEKPSEHGKYMAEHAFHLLHEWNQTPGTQENGGIDEKQLQSWCAKARELATASGRIEVCDVQIGEMLSRNQLTDDDGAWPCRAIRNIIETVGTDSIRSGLSCGIRNSRGVVSRGEGGAQERDLTAKYRALADRFRFDSPVTAGVLEGVAKSYASEANWWDEREKWGD